ncbi:hypothetical protein GCM10007100_21900 [Roseibacillus persicicus]|uniref:Uncharacterized protein n=1 Tax=Roseibacillus persicicus TaxID=454148 RepID=A0A918TSQ7_9BACT|nr:hypothetical protein GCM10007100_21900 [Roseibacillus persicicus]
MKETTRAGCPIVEEGPKPFIQPFTCLGGEIEGSLPGERSCESALQIGKVFSGHQVTLVDNQPFSLLELFAIDVSYIAVKVAFVPLATQSGESPTSIQYDREGSQSERRFVDLFQGSNDSRHQVGTAPYRLGHNHIWARLLREGFNCPHQFLQATTEAASRDFTH